MAQGGGAMRDWGEEAIAEVFLHDVDPAVVQENARYSGAPGEGMFTEPWPLAAWPEVVTRVLVPSGDRLSRWTFSGASRGSG